MSEYYCKHGQPEGAPCDECAAKQEGVSELAAPPLLCLTVDEAKIIRKLLGDLPQSKVWHDLTDEQYELFCGTTWPKLQKATSDEVRHNERSSGA